MSFVALFSKYIMTEFVSIQNDDLQIKAYTSPQVASDVLCSKHLANGFPRCSTDTAYLCRSGTGPHRWRTSF